MPVKCIQSLRMFRALLRCVFESTLKGLLLALPGRGKACFLAVSLLAFIA